MASPSPTNERPSIYLSVAATTDVGRVRQGNEDAFVVADLTGGTLLDDQPRLRFDVGERGVLLAVSDGMGGARAGEVASALVVETLTRAMAAAPSDAPRDELMKHAVERAHRAVWEAAHLESRRGMGATLTAVFVRGDDAFIAEVGDSRAYLLRGGEIAQLTKDQSMVQMLQDSGLITPEEVASSPVRNVLMQAMGHGEGVQVALGRLQLRNRDCFILCSDGLTGHVPDAEIRDVVLASPRLDVACQRLVALANERGGKDNITVIAAGVGGRLPAAGAGEDAASALEILQSFERALPPR